MATSPPITLPRTLTTLHLVGLGLGCMIGSGLFLLTGMTMATETGPAILLSFVLAGSVSLLAGLCYAEVVLEAPSAGAAYSVARRYFGEFAAWLTAAFMVLEYTSAMAVLAQGVSQYLAVFANLRAWVLACPTDPVPTLVIAGVAAVLALGSRRGHFINAIAVAVKLLAVVIVLALGWHYVTLDALRPLVPTREIDSEGVGHFGWQGIIVGAGMIFCAMCGQESITSAAEECRRPQRDLRRAMFLCVLIAAILYMLVAVVMAGMLPYRQLNSPHALIDAFTARHATGAVAIIRGTGVLGMVTVIYATLNASSRTVFALSRDGYFHRRLATIHPTTGSPTTCILIIASLAAIVATALPLTKLVGLINLGTLGAFACVALAVLRKPTTGQTRSSTMRAIAGVSLSATCVLAAFILRSSWRTAAIFLLVTVAGYLIAQRQRRHVDRTLFSVPIHETASLTRSLLAEPQPGTQQGDPRKVPTHVGPG